MYYPIFSYAQITSDSLHSDSLGYYSDEGEMTDIENYEYSETDEYYEKKDIRHMGELNFILSKGVFPKKRKFTHRPAGFDLAYFRQINENVPLFGTFGFSWSFYGFESLEYFEPSGTTDYGDDWEETFNANILSLNAGARYFAGKNRKSFNPYFQVDFKFRYLFGMISTKNIEYGETVDSYTKGGNGSIGFGITTGSLVNLGNDNLALNLSVTFDGGGGMKYFLRKDNPGPIVYVTDNFEQKLLPTSLLSFRIGIIFF